MFTSAVHIPSVLLITYFAIFYLKESNGGPLSTPKLTRTVPSRDSVYNTGDAASEATINSHDFGIDSAHSSTTAAFSVDYETRDGSARNGKDYHGLKGTFVSDDLL